MGGHGAGKRIDAAAAVLWAEGTVDDLAWMDLSYAPPFSTAWEVLQVAARRVAERLLRETAPVRHPWPAGHRTVGVWRSYSGMPLSGGASSAWPERPR